MAIQDKALTLIGAQAAVSSILVTPNADGSVTLTAYGSTKDNLGGTEQLVPATLRVTGVPAIDNLVARGLSELRKANGLEV